MIVTRKEPAKRLGSNTEKMHAKTSLALKTTDSNDRNRPCLRSRIKDVQNRANGVKRQRITGTGADVANASCKVDKKELKLSTDQEKVRSRLTTNKRTFCRTDLSDVEGDSDGEMATRAKNARVSRKPLALEDNKNRFSAKDDKYMSNVESPRNGNAIDRVRKKDPPAKGLAELRHRQELKHNSLLTDSESENK